MSHETTAQDAPPQNKVRASMRAEVTTYDADGNVLADLFTGEPDGPADPNMLAAVALGLTAVEDPASSVARVRVLWWSP